MEGQRILHLAKLIFLFLWIILIKILNTVPILRKTDGYRIHYVDTYEEEKQSGSARVGQDPWAMSSIILEVKGVAFYSVECSAYGLFKLPKDF